MRYHGSALYEFTICLLTKSDVKLCSPIIATFCDVASGPVPVIHIDGDDDDEDDNVPMNQAVESADDNSGEMTLADDSPVRNGTHYCHVHRYSCISSRWINSFKSLFSNVTPCPVMRVSITMDPFPVLMSVARSCCVN